ncbi:MAG: hypothetical protein J6T15_04060 [Bacilli bacterium]|nr:hypothetical protein [Bacilli bacterium]
MKKRKYLFVTLLSFLCLTACKKTASDLFPWVKTIAYVEDSEFPCEIIYKASNETVTPSLINFNSERYSTAKEDFETVLSYLNSLSFEKTKDDIAPGSANFSLEIAIPSVGQNPKQYVYHYFGFSDGITYRNGEYYKVSNTRFPTLSKDEGRLYFMSSAVTDMKAYDLEDGEKDVTDVFWTLVNLKNLRFKEANFDTEELNSFSRYEFRNERGKIRFYSETKFSIYSEDDLPNLTTYEIVKNCKFSFRSLKGQLPK